MCIRDSPTFECEIIHSENHGSFLGINRARNALIEACILATRINLLPQKKILSELEYLENAILKTSGKIEQVSWNKLKKFIDKKFINKYSFRDTTYVEDNTSVEPFYHKMQCKGCGNKVTQKVCLLYTSPSPRDRTRSRMPSSA